MISFLDLRLWLAAALALALAWGGAERTRAGAVTKQRDAARGEAKGLRGAIDAQKAEASATFAALKGEADAKQKQLDAAHAAQEKTDAQNIATVGGLRNQLRRERMQRDAEAAGRGDGGGGAAGQAGAGAHAGAAGGASAVGLFPDAEAAADEDAYLADRVNEAYRSCRTGLMTGSDASVSR